MSATRRLIDEQAVENFRSEFHYDASDWTALYVRGDLVTDDLQTVVPALAERARAHEPLVRERDYEPLVKRFWRGSAVD